MRSLFPFWQGFVGLNAGFLGQNDATNISCAKILGLITFSTGSIALVKLWTHLGAGGYTFPSALTI